MTYAEMLQELEMMGFEVSILHCFTLAYDGGATDGELQDLYYVLLASDY